MLALPCPLYRRATKLTKRCCRQPAGCSKRGAHDLSSQNPINDFAPELTITHATLTDREQAAWSRRCMTSGSSAAIAVALFQSDERLLTDNKQSFGQFIVGTVLVSTGPTSQ